MRITTTSIPVVFTTSLYVLTAGAPSTSISFTSRLDGSYILYSTITGAPPPDITWQTSSEGNTSTSHFSLFHTLILVRTFTLELKPTNDLLDYTCTATLVFNGMTWTANDSILRLAKLRPLMNIWLHPVLVSTSLQSARKNLARVHYVLRSTNQLKHIKTHWLSPIEFAIFTSSDFNFN